jgi:hypothetical protein
MSRDVGLVQRLISFLKKPNALEYDERETVHNPYDDYQPRDYQRSEARVDSAPVEPTMNGPLVSGRLHSSTYGSRLDALVVRALQQFHAPLGFVIRYDDKGRMHYCTGRDYQGHYVGHTEVNPDRRALFLALDTGQSQLFVHADNDIPTAVLCGPLWVNNEVVGLLYLDNPARSHLHRGVFDIFCDQAARLLEDGVG